MTNMTFAAIVSIMFKATVTDTQITADGVGASGRFTVADSSQAFIYVCKIHYMFTRSEDLCKLGI